MLSIIKDKVSVAGLESYSLILTMLTIKLTHLKSIELQYKYIVII